MYIYYADVVCTEIYFILNIQVSANVKHKSDCFFKVHLNIWYNITGDGMIFHVQFTTHLPYKTTYCNMMLHIDGLMH